jgi:hypothetical protein
MFGTFYVSCSKEIDMTTNLQFRVEMFQLGWSQLPNGSSWTTKCSSFHGIKHTRSFHNLKCYKFFQYQVTMCSSPLGTIFSSTSCSPAFYFCTHFILKAFLIPSSQVWFNVLTKESKVQMFGSGVNRHPSQKESSSHVEIKWLVFSCQLHFGLRIASHYQWWSIDIRSKY